MATAVSGGALNPAADDEGAASPPPKEDCGVKGQEYLTPYLDKSKSECLNEADEHPYAHCLNDGGGYLESDCDEQIILSLSFSQVYLLHTILHSVIMSDVVARSFSSL